MNLQAEYDLRVAKQALHDKIAPRIRVCCQPGLKNVWHRALARVNSV